MMSRFGTASRSTARFTRVAVALGVVVSALLLPPPAAAVQAPRRGWYHTGDGVITKDALILEVDVFAVGHDMKCLPEHKSGSSVVAAECDKRFTWRALRDVGKSDIRDALYHGYAAVDYGDGTKVRRAVSAFEAGLAEGAVVTISYDAQKQSTTFSPPRGAKVTVGGADFMRATWRILFANPELRRVGDALLSKL